MDDKASLLAQLRIDRGDEGHTSGAQRGPDDRQIRRWQAVAAFCAILALICGAFAAWQFLQRSHGAAVQSPAGAGTAGGSPSATALAATGAGAPDADGSDAGDSAATAAAGLRDGAASTSTSTSASGVGPRVIGVSVLDASGYIVARREATVSAKTTGRVRALYIEEGQRVRAGEIIARLDDSNTLAALAQARAQLAQAEANLEAARIALADARPIFLRNEQERTASVISAQDFDTAKSAYDSAEANYATQQAAVAAARANLLAAERYEDDTIVRAPFSGVVTDKAAQEGEIVSPVSAGGGFTRTGICTIVDMDSLEAEVDVSENFIHRVHPGQPALVRLKAYPDWAIPAHVVAIIPTADRSKATVKVRVGFAARDPRILPEMGARVSFLAETERTGHAKRQRGEL